MKHPAPSKEEIQRLLDALSIPNNAEQHSAMREWMRWSGFPKPDKSGAHPVEKVRAWVDANYEKIAHYWRRRAVLTGEFKESDIKAMGKHEPEQAGSEQPAELGSVDTQTALAEALANHYGDKIRIVINAQRIQDWRRGRSLPAGAKRPPLPNGKYWNVGDWVKWFDEHMMPTYRVGMDVGGEFVSMRKLADMKLRDELEELEHRKKQREIENGLYLRKEEVAAVSAGVGDVLRREIVQQFEKHIERKIGEKVRQMDMSVDQRNTIMNVIREQARTGTDAVLSELAAVLNGLKAA